MSTREREGLIARIRQIRGGSAGGDERERPSPSVPAQHDLQMLRARIVHLEQLVQGLQDAVHRESTRLGKRVDEVEARIQPAALGKAMDEDARRRGL